MERKKVISLLERMLTWMGEENCEALKCAISSIKTDEAYQLEYEDRDCVEVVRCKDCKWFGKVGCAIQIVDDYDKPAENDFCSFAELKEVEDGNDD